MLLRSANVNISASWPFLHDKTANKPTESNIISYKPMQEENSMGEPSDRSVQHKIPSSDNVKSSKSPKRKAELGIAVDTMLIKTLQDLGAENEKPSERSVPVDESADSLFGRSFITIIGNLTAKKNRYAKMKIQQLLYEIEFDDSL